LREQFNKLQRIRDVDKLRPLERRQYALLRMWDATFRRLNQAARSLHERDRDEAERRVRQRMQRLSERYGKRLEAVPEAALVR